MSYNKTQNMDTDITSKLDLLPIEIKRLIIKYISTRSKLIFDLSLDTKLREITYKEKYNIVLEELESVMQPEEHYIEDIHKFDHYYGEFEWEKRDFNCYEGFEYLDF